MRAAKGVSRRLAGACRPACRSRATAAGDRATAGQLKEDLLAALKASQRDVSAPGIQSIVSQLGDANPTAELTNDLDALTGDWITVGQERVPGGLGVTEEGEQVVTVGRASFNMFTPLNLRIACEPTENFLQLRSREDGTLSYDVRFAFRTADDSVAPAVRGVMENYAVARPHPEMPRRLEVTFTGGKLYAVPDATAEEKVQFVELFKQQGEGVGLSALFARGVAQLLFGLRPAQWNDDMTVSYSMDKSPKGYLDVVYLDEDMRITVGNRGTCFVVVRQKSEK